MARKTPARLEPAQSPAAHRRLQACLAALLPASRLTLALEHPMDTARALVTSAALDVTAALPLKAAASALGRTTRSLRMLHERFGGDALYDQIDASENVVRRAEELLEEGPMTHTELTGHLPQYYAFDSASVALRALSKAGRVRRLPAQHEIDVRYELVTAPPSSALRRGGAEIQAVTAHMAAVMRHVERATDLEGEGASLATDCVSARPRDFAQARADIEAFIEAGIDRLAAGATPDSPAFEMHFGASQKAV